MAEPLTSFLTKAVELSYLPSTKYFGLLNSVSCPFDRTTNDEECLAMLSVSKGCWLLVVGCLTSQQHTSVSQARICSDNFTCRHTETEAADQTFYLTQSQYTDTGPTSPSADPITPGAWQGSHWSANFEVTGRTQPRKILAQARFERGIFRSRGGRLNH